MINLKKHKNAVWEIKINRPEKANSLSLQMLEELFNIIEKANKFLIKKYLHRGYSSKDWKIKKIDNKGNLIIYSKSQEKVLKRF